MKYNLIIGYEDITDESGFYEEPVAIEEAKDWLRIEGFIDDEDSTTSFDDDDVFISGLITSARERIELWTGLTIVRKTWEVELTNLAGNISLPFPPILDVVSVSDSEDSTDTAIDFTTTRDKRKLKTPLCENLLVTYDAGYTEFPEWVREAILKEVAYRYEHRGDEELRGLCQDALVICSPYKQVDTWLG